MLTPTVEIQPVKCWIQEKFFYNLDLTKTDMKRCEIFAISSYQGSNLSLNVKILENGGLFHDLPVWCAYTDKEIKETFNKNELCYSCCPSNNITINKFNYLNDRCWVWFPTRKTWFEAEYIATIDWFQQNQNSHFCSLACGQFCFMPSHKILFCSNKPINSPPSYQKKRYHN